jgi:hypothetical protein
VRAILRWLLAVFHPSLWYSVLSALGGASLLRAPGFGASR